MFFVPHSSSMPNLGQISGGKRCLGAPDDVSGRDLDKFMAFGLTPIPAARVAPPLVAECFANLECKVADTSLVKRYNLFVFEVLKAWRDPAQKNPKTIHHQGYGKFIVDGETIKLKSRMR